MAHTKGPWSFSKRGQRVYGGITNGRNIAQISVIPEFEANGRLIAAAPDMLEALRKFAAIEIWLDGPHVTENMPNGYSDPQLWREHVFAARRAIAAATGEV